MVLTEHVEAVQSIVPEHSSGFHKRLWPRPFTPSSPARMLALGGQKGSVLDTWGARSRQHLPPRRDRLLLGTGFCPLSIATHGLFGFFLRLPPTLILRLNECNETGLICC